eukprot:9797838-Ditylum_brightwellii.AAC.1
MLPRVYVSLYPGILATVEPSEKVSEKFLHGYEVGMQTGDIFFALYNARVYCTYRFYCGVSLDVLVRDIEVWKQQATEYKQIWHWNAFSDTSQQLSDFLSEGIDSLNKNIEDKRHRPAT